MVDSLTSAARFHAVDMSEEDYFSHTSHDRVNGELVESCSWDDRLSVYYSNWNLISENIAAGFGTPQTVVDGWMDGQHRSSKEYSFAQQLGDGDRLFQGEWRL